MKRKRRYRRRKINPAVFTVRPSESDLRVLLAERLKDVAQDFLLWTLDPEVEEKEDYEEDRIEAQKKFQQMCGAVEMMVSSNSISLDVLTDLWDMYASKKGEV